MNRIVKHTVPTPYVVGEAHFYSTEIEGEIVLFDTGPPTEEGVAYLERALDLSRLKHVFITHCHSDHFGLTGYLEEHTDAQIYIPRIDDLRLRYRQQRKEALIELLHDAGYDRSFGEGMKSVSVGSPGASAPVSRYRIVEETDALKRLGISYLSCPGHSQSDTVYLLDGNAITGDLLLRNIFQTPVLELDFTTMKGRYRNYRAYCDSLANLWTLNGMHILPGHREAIDGVEPAILFYVGKLLERAGKIKRYAALEKVSEVVRAVFGETLVDPFFIYMKVSEMIFLRDFLAEPERLKGALEPIGLFEPVRKRYEQVAG